MLIKIIGLNYTIWKYVILVKAEYVSYKIGSYFYAVKLNVNITEINISKCSNFTEDIIGSINFVGETSGFIHTGFWISYVFSLAFWCLDFKEIIKTIKDEMNENYGNGENQDFCLKFASNIPCVLCMRGTRKDIFI